MKGCQAVISGLPKGFIPAPLLITVYINDLAKGDQRTQGARGHHLASQYDQD